MFNLSSRRGIAMPAVVGIVAVVVLLGLAAFYFGSPSGPGNVNTENTGGNMMRKSLTVKLDPVNNSGRSGTAVLTEEGGKIRATISLKNESAAAAVDSYPAHIHTGICPTPGGIKYMLPPVVNGTSETMVDISLDDLLKQLPLAINVHKSQSDLKTYVACGNIPAEGIVTGSPSGMMGGNTPGMMQAGKTYTVEMTSKGFAPANLTIAKGDTVEFVNKDTAKHWPATAVHPAHTVYPGSDIKKCGTSFAITMFDSCRGLAQGETWPFTFNEVGSWKYHDHLSATLWGEITVK